jgi:uncharacterized damage-inducible protein DinB
VSGSASAFVRQAAGYLRDTYVPRLECALQTLPSEDLWWRPHPGALSVGNVLLHLEGNVRQWIVSGMGGAPDERDRASELSALEGADGAELLERLAATAREAAAVIEALDEAALSATWRIQGDEVEGLAAVLHVVEHFSWHTGQVVWIAKARAGAGHGLAFFDDAKANAARNG